MVYSFLVSSQNDNKLCYWEPYIALADKDRCNGEIRVQENENIDLVLSRVTEELLFQEEVKSLVIDQSSKVSMDPLCGTLSLSKDQLNCKFPCNVIWETCFKCCFMLVIDKNENIALAENILKLIIRYATNIFNMIEEHEKQIRLYPERMTAVLHIFLPSGKLIFMNHRVVKQFEKDLDKILSERK